MNTSSKPAPTATISSFDQFAQLANYSLMDSLNADPEATEDGIDHRARQVFSGHYVPVKPTPLPSPEYIAHSSALFNELGLSEELAKSEAFIRLFSGDVSVSQPPMRPIGWATGYALSIYGTEYIQQCPFKTGNGYGDGRAISVFEMLNNGKRWEMQLKGGGQTPYCRGADGRAVLRSSVREFLAQEYMHALGVPTSRSLALIVSKSETVNRPWYSNHSLSPDPDILVSNPVAITTRVAPSFLRVGQIELFARRTRDANNADALSELRVIVEHLIEREYKEEIDQSTNFDVQLIELATHMRERLTSLITHWLRTGFCQGNFNSDNCAAGGFTLDYGPFGFCEQFNPEFQPWTGGGKHFSFFNQPAAAEANYHMFWNALLPLLSNDKTALEQFQAVRQGFTESMKNKLQSMWAQKLGLQEYNHALTSQLWQLMQKTQVDYGIFFRELCNLPTDIAMLQKSFYTNPTAEINALWQQWLADWQSLISNASDQKTLKCEMKKVNPKYTWREWLVVPAYQQAMQGDYRLIKELQQVFSSPYDEQSKAIEEKYYRLQPEEFKFAGGISHYSCSS